MKNLKLLEETGWIRISHIIPEKSEYYLVVKGETVTRPLTLEEAIELQTIREKLRNELKAS